MTPTISSEKDNIIKDTYYNPEGGYVGIDKIYAKVKKQGITKQQVKDWFNKQQNYQLKKRTNLASFIAPYPLFEFEIDLIYIDNPVLNKAGFALTCIDVFTKIADAELIKRKTMEDVADAMKIILKRMGTPEHIYSDLGSEFIGSDFQELLEEHKIDWQGSLGHANFIESWHRTIKRMIGSYLDATKSKTITNVFHKLINTYNNTIHKTIKMIPNDAAKPENRAKVFFNILEAAKKYKRGPLKVGDKVRRRIKREPFSKEWNSPTWTKTIYTISRVERPYYYLEGDDFKYARAFITRVEDVEEHDIEADDEGTTEGNLKRLGKMPVSEPSRKMAKELKELAVKEPVASRTRERPKVDYKKLAKGN